MYQWDDQAPGTKTRNQTGPLAGLEVCVIACKKRL